MTGPCALCRAIADSDSKNRPIYNTHLYSSPNFVILPTVGPIVPGHVMVVSKSHVPNLAAMGPNCIVEYNEIVDALVNQRQSAYQNILEAEHGASLHDLGGACIDHVHINVIPGFGSSVNLLDDKLPRIDLEPALETLRSSAAPYIFLRGNRNVRLYRAVNVPSQYIRRILFESVGRDDWDWGAFQHRQVIEETIRLWTTSTNDSKI